MITLGIADEIIKEPFGGAHRNFDEAAEYLGTALKKHLAELGKLSGAKLKEQRYNKFRAMGKVEELATETAQ